MKRIFSIILLFAFLFVVPVRAASLLELRGAIDWSCIKFQIIGLCFKKSPPFVGIKIRYWEPVLLIETVKMPGDSVIDIFGSIVKPMAQKASKTLMGGVTGLDIPMTSGSGSQSVPTTNLQFNEVHIYSFPFASLFSLLVSTECSSSPVIPGVIYYLSELDSPEWRVGLLESLSPKSMLSASLGPVCSLLGGYDQNLCMGSWGPVYPRRGFITHQSEVVGSAADVYRAVSIASKTDFTPHVVLTPLGFFPDTNKDKLQLIYPSPGGCIKIGENPAFWEGGKTSFNGKYVWVYWRYRECCIF